MLLFVAFLAAGEVNTSGSWGNNEEEEEESLLFILTFFNSASALAKMTLIINKESATGAFNE